MRHTACSVRPRRLTRAEQQRREAAFFDRGLVVNTSAVNLGCRMLGLTRTGLAQVMGMDRVHVSRVIAGELSASPEFRYRLSLALPDAEPQELFVTPGSAGATVDLETPTDGEDTDASDGDAA